MTLKLHYSGNLSKPFWKEVKEIKDDGWHESLYMVGVTLQNLEQSMLQMLRVAQDEEVKTQLAQAERNV